MNAVQKDKEEKTRILQNKYKKISDNQLKNMEEGKYIAPTDVNKDPYAENFDQRLTKAQDWNQRSNNEMNYKNAAVNGLTFGGKKRRRSKKIKSKKRGKSRRRTRR